MYTPSYHNIYTNCEGQGHGEDSNWTSGKTFVVMVNLNIPHGDFIHQQLTQTPKTISFQINQIAHKHKS